MAVVGGTVGYKAGQILVVSEGICCDNHPDVQATKRVVGEADEFGYEASDYCDVCFETYSQIKVVANQCCDWCGCHSTHLRPMNNVDSDSKDVIDKVCDSCIGKLVHKSLDESTRIDGCSNDHGVEIYQDRDEDNEDYRYQPDCENDPQPLNFNSSRW